MSRLRFGQEYFALAAVLALSLCASAPEAQSTPNTRSAMNSGCEVTLSPDAISFYMRGIYQKLQVHSKSEAVARASWPDECGEPSAASRVYDERPASRRALDPAPGLQTENCSLDNADDLVHRFICVHLSRAKPRDLWFNSSNAVFSNAKKCAERAIAHTALCYT